MVLHRSKELKIKEDSKKWKNFSSTEKKKRKEKKASVADVWVLHIPSTKISFKHLCKLHTLKR